MLFPVKLLENPASGYTSYTAKRSDKLVEYLFHDKYYCVFQ
jgi:hypothetical protein